ncbi:hypothetical protein H7H51_24150 [Mycolicibacterium farcinogenes]|nr:hypothetical protein [Mycolicibacterium farcinogenes]
MTSAPDAAAVRPRYTTRDLLLDPGRLNRRLRELDCIAELVRRQPKTLAAVADRSRGGIHNHYVDGMPRLLPMVVAWARGAHLADVDETSTSISTTDVERTFSGMPPRW